mgnify:CR=1 FL=1|jgi:hypothetical protein
MSAKTSARKALRQAAMLGVAAVIAASFVGAGEYEWSMAPKDDRLPSMADCRGARPDRDACAGVTLAPSAASTVTSIGGLSIVERTR